MANEYVEIIPGWFPTGMAMPETTMPACQACGFSSSSARTGAFPPSYLIYNLLLRLFTALFLKSGFLLLVYLLQQGNFVQYVI